MTRSLQLLLCPAADRPAGGGGIAQKLKTYAAP